MANTTIREVEKLTGFELTEAQRRFVEACERGERLQVMRGRANGWSQVHKAIAEVLSPWRLRLCTPPGCSSP
jgi:hypothetical protein